MALRQNFSVSFKLSLFTVENHELLLDDFKALLKILVLLRGVTSDTQKNTTTHVLID